MSVTYRKRPQIGESRTGPKTRPRPQSLWGGLALALVSPKPQSGHSIPQTSLPPQASGIELASVARVMQNLIKKMKAGLVLRFLNVWTEKLVNGIFFCQPTLMSPLPGSMSYFLRGGSMLAASH